MIPMLSLSKLDLKRKYISGNTRSYQYKSGTTISNNMRERINLLQTKTSLMLLLSQTYWKNTFAIL